MLISQPTAYSRKITWSRLKFCENSKGKGFAVVGFKLKKITCMNVLWDNFIGQLDSVSYKYIYTVLYQYHRS